MEFPTHSEIDTNKLSNIFGNTTNSYKHYWFLSILDAIAEGQGVKMDLDDLAMRMVANVWYPLDYYKLSFGKQDGFKKIADYISENLSINHSVNAKGLFFQINEQLKKEHIKVVTLMVKERLRWVPYRFLRPFFELELRGLKDQNVNRNIISITNNFFEKDKYRVVYKFENNSIIINQNWYHYFRNHLHILKGFTYWHLIGFLQKNNPNVPGIAKKIFKPEQRNLTSAIKLWKTFLTENPDFRCVYSNTVLKDSELSLDHFLPWSFVVHDQLWNLIPTPKNINSSKSNWLPEWSYFPQFARSQFELFSFYQKKGRLRPLEDYYLTILSGNKINNEKEFITRLEDQMLPQYQIAKNMGFSFPFIFNEKI